MTCPPHGHPGHPDCRAAGRDSTPETEGEAVGRNGVTRDGKGRWWK